MIDGRDIMQEIKIKYFSEEIEKLTYIGGKSDWIDLRAAQRVFIYVQILLLGTGDI